MSLMLISSDKSFYIYNEISLHIFSVQKKVTINVSRVQSGNQEQRSMSFPGLSWTILVIFKGIYILYAVSGKSFCAHGQSLAQTFLHAKIFLTMASEFQGWTLQDYWKSSTFQGYYWKSRLSRTFKDCTNPKTNPEGGALEMMWYYIVYCLYLAYWSAGSSSFFTDSILGREHLSNWYIMIIF